MLFIAEMMLHFVAVLIFFLTIQIGLSSGHKCTSASNRLFPTTGQLRPSGDPLSGLGILRQSDDTISVLPGRCAPDDSFIWDFLPPSVLQDCYPTPYDYCAINETVEKDASELLHKRFLPVASQTVPNYFRLTSQDTVYALLVVKQTKQQYKNLKASLENSDATEEALVHLFNRAKRGHFQWLPADSLKRPVSYCLRRRFHHKGDSSSDYSKETGEMRVSRYSVDCKTIMTVGTTRYLRISLMAHLTVYKAPENVVIYDKTLHGNRRDFVPCNNQSSGQEDEQYGKRVRPDEEDESETIRVTYTEDADQPAQERLPSTTEKPK